MTKPCHTIAEILENLEKILIHSNWKKKYPKELENPNYCCKNNKKSWTISVFFFKYFLSSVIGFLTTSNKMIIQGMENVNCSFLISPQTMLTAAEKLVAMT